MKLITMTGKHLKTYSGADAADGRVVALRIYPGMTVEVSDRKADQLLRDYPDDFKAGGRVVKDKVKPPEPEVEETPDEPEEKVQEAEVVEEAEGEKPFEVKTRPKPSGKKPQRNKAIVLSKKHKRR